MTFWNHLHAVLEHEGGSKFTNDPVDPGGATKFGVSLRHLLSRGDLDRDGLPDGDVDGDGDVDIDDVKALPIDKVAWIYRTGFWEPNRLNELQEDALAGKLFDMAVNMGSKQMWRIAQRVLNAQLGFNLRIDGALGNRTMAALHCGEFKGLVKHLCDAQAQFYLGLIEKRPALAKYRTGWLRRAAWTP